MNFHRFRQHQNSEIYSVYPQTDYFRKDIQHREDKNM